MTKPLIFLGSNSNLIMFIEAAEDMGIQVHGVLDNDYFGNTESIYDIPYVGTEDTFDFEKEKNNYVFFVAPSVVPINTRDRAKRLKMIDIVDRYNLPLVTIMNKSCFVSRSAKVHPGCFIGYIACVAQCAEVMPHSQVHTMSAVGHHSVLGKNSVLERGAMLISHTVVGENVHIGFGSAICKDGGMTVGSNAVVHPRLTVLRDIEENEIISLAGDNTRRIYGEIIRK